LIIKFEYEGRENSEKAYLGFDCIVSKYSDFYRYLSNKLGTFIPARIPQRTIKIGFSRKDRVPLRYSVELKGEGCMRVIIAEDNPVELRYIKNLLSKDSDIALVGEANNGIEAINLISKTKPDVAFLDISMPVKSGLEVAKELNENISVVFITAHNDFALEAFSVGSIDYILKPIDPERIKKTITRIKRITYNKNTTQKIAVNIKRQILFLDVNKIIYLEKLPLVKKILFALENNQEINVSGTLEGFDEQLKYYGFVRSHKSYIINLNKISRIIPWGDNTYLVKFNGTEKEVMISRSYLPAIKSILRIRK